MERKLNSGNCKQCFSPCLVLAQLQLKTADLKKAGDTLEAMSALVSSTDVLRRATRSPLYGSLTGVWGSSLLSMKASTESKSSSAESGVAYRLVDVSPWSCCPVEDWFCAEVTEMGVKGSMIGFVPLRASARASKADSLLDLRNLQVAYLQPMIQLPGKNKDIVLWSSIITRC